jgi:hypothetical protein
MHSPQHSLAIVHLQAQQLLHLVLLPAVRAGYLLRLACVATQTISLILAGMLQYLAVTSSTFQLLLIINATT